MSGVLRRQIEKAREIERRIVQGDARICRPAFGAVCKALWPFKTAEELAFRAGCCVRTAGYEISGERDPSAQSIQAVINEIVPKR